MPNGDDKNWMRVCSAIDGFRSHFGRWPKRVRMSRLSFLDLTSNVLTPLGFAVVSSVLELCQEDDATMIADDGTGAEYNYGSGRSSGRGRRLEVETSAYSWFGEAILRHDTRSGFDESINTRSDSKRRVAEDSARTEAGHHPQKVKKLLGSSNSGKKKTRKN